MHNDPTLLGALAFIALCAISCVIAALGALMLDPNFRNESGGFIKTYGFWRGIAKLMKSTPSTP